MKQLLRQIEECFDGIKAGRIEIYNEFSLQHELGFFLRNSLGSRYKVHFEKPITEYGLKRGDYTKKEIDISLFNSTNNDREVAIELKFPRQGQYPEQMYSSICDIVFLEELVNYGGFRFGIFVMVADDELFFRTEESEKIYKYFRSNVPIQGRIYKPTGTPKSHVNVLGSYAVKWKSITKNMKYFTVPIFRGLTTA